MLGDRARLLSPTVRLNACNVQFWYHMYGDTINTLNVYTKTYGNGGGSVEALQWSMTGDQGNMWKFGSLTFDLDTSFQVVMFSYARDNAKHK